MIVTGLGVVTGGVVTEAGTVSAGKPGVVKRVVMGVTVGGMMVEQGSVTVTVLPRVIVS